VLRADSHEEVFVSRVIEDLHKSADITIVAPCSKMRCGVGCEARARARARARLRLEIGLCSACRVSHRRSWQHGEQTVGTEGAIHSDCLLNTSTYLAQAVGQQRDQRCD
jgi:hypothetical protein